MLFSLYMQERTDHQLSLFDPQDFASLKGPSLSSLRVQDFKKLSFGSRSEMALAILFQKYLPNWEAKQGETYQIPLGNHRYCDFRVKNILFEYHPIVTRWHMRDKNAYHMFNDALKKVKDPKLKKTILKSLEIELESQYERERNLIVQSHPDPIISRCRVVIATTPAEVVKRLLRPILTNPPKLATFEDEFAEIISSGPSKPKKR